MSESESPVGKLCTQCDTVIWAKPKTAPHVFSDYKTGEKVELSFETEVWGCDCGTRVYEDDFHLKMWEQYCEYNNFVSPSRLKKLRERLGLSQEELASLLGTEPTNVPRWEAGEFVPHGADEKLLLKMEEEV